MLYSMGTGRFCMILSGHREFLCHIQWESGGIVSYSVGTMRSCVTFSGIREFLCHI